jgi:K+-sensing histidine kinase KdpD
MYGGMPPNDKKMNLILKIVDSGKGIKKESLEKLFIKFNRLEDK